MRYKENIPIVDKIDWVSDKIEALNMSPKALAHSIAKTEMLEKAYNLFKENPNISKEEYLDIMGLEE